MVYLYSSCATSGIARFNVEGSFSDPLTVYRYLVYRASNFWARKEILYSSNAPSFISTTFAYTENTYRSWRPDQRNVHSFLRGYQTYSTSLLSCLCADVVLPIAHKLALLKTFCNILPYGAIMFRAAVAGTSYMSMARTVTFVQYYLVVLAYLTNNWAFQNTILLNHFASMLDCGLYAGEVAKICCFE